MSWRRLNTVRLADPVTSLVAQDERFKANNSDRINTKVLIVYDLGLL